MVDGDPCSHVGMELGISSSAAIANYCIGDFVVGTSIQMTMFHMPVAILLQLPVSPLHEALTIEKISVQKNKSACMFTFHIALVALHIP